MSLVAAAVTSAVTIKPGRTVAVTSRQKRKGKRQTHAEQSAAGVCKGQINQIAYHVHAATLARNETIS